MTAGLAASIHARLLNRAKARSEVKLNGERVL